MTTTSPVPMTINSSISQIALVEPAVETEFYLTSIFAQIRCEFPLLQSELKRRGYHCQIFAEELIDFSPAVVRAIASFDLVALSVTCTTFHRTRELVRQLKASNPRLLVVCGGVGVKFYADYLLQFADYVINGDGEGVLGDLLDSLNKGERYPEAEGLGYTRPHEPPLIPRFRLSTQHNVSDYSNIKGYTYFTPKKSPFGFHKVLRHSLYASKGCVNNCSFCPCRSPYRQRSMEQVLHDLRSLLATFENDRVPHLFMLVDDCPYGDMDYFKELLRRIASEIRGRNCLFDTQIRATSLLDEELVKLLVQARFYSVAVGFESSNQNVLDAMNKGTTVEENIQAIEMCRRFGLSPYGFFIVGFPQDHLESVDEVTEFILQHGLIGQLLPFANFVRNPHTGQFAPLSEEILDEFAYGGVIYVSNVQKNFAPSALQQRLWQSYQRIFSLRRLPRLKTRTEKLYTWTYRNLLRLWRPKVEHHIHYLQSLGL
jgi:radical SAM superfamily enzyme YgiQ (UPF0313 family)